jgi:adhesin/invasin
VAVDTAGNVLISDGFNNRVRRVDAVDGTIMTVAGSGAPMPAGGFCGDGGLASNACLDSPHGIAVDTDGNVSFSDRGNNRIRRVDAATRIITTVAGNGSAAFCGDSGLATGACLNSPSDVAVDAAGNWLIADRVNQRIRRVDATTRACLFNPGGVAVDPVSGGLLIADTDNHRVRRSGVLHRDGLTREKPPETPE